MAKSFKLRKVAATALTTALVASAIAPVATSAATKKKAPTIKVKSLKSWSAKTLRAYVNLTNGKTVAMKVVYLPKKRSY
jgi:outer membrane protein assembly factor BamA